MARIQSSYLPEEEETAQPPWAAILRARGLAPEAPPTPLVGNASPAEVPGQSAQAYADAAQAEKAEGNEDAAARLTVRATEARAQESAAQGTPEPATPLAPVAQAPASAAPKMTMAPSAERGVEPMPWSWAVSRGNGQQAPQATTTTAQSPYGDFGEPPQYERASPGVSFFALALDAMLNKGRNAGRLVGQLAEGDDGYTNYQRRMKAAKDAADIEATKRRGLLTPEEEEHKRRRLEIAEAALAARQKQLEQSATAEQRRVEAQRIKFDPEHPMAEQVRQSLYAEGVRPGSLDGLGMEAMKAGLNEAQRNRVELAMSGELNAAAADKAAGVARATEGSKIRVAEGTARVTQPYKMELAEAAAATRQGEREADAALDEEKDINAKRRVRAAARVKELETLESILERIEKKDPKAALPKQGHVIDRGIVTFKAELLGGTGLSEEDSLLDSDLTMAGLQSYISEASNAPNSLPEQTESGRKYRGDGTYGGAAAAIRKRLKQIDAGETRLREEEDATRIHSPRKPAAPKRPAPRRPAPAATIPADDLEF